MSDELPNGCAVNAVCMAWATLRKFGAPARILAMVCGDGEAHAAAIFEAPGGAIFAYDSLRGSRQLHGAAMHHHPLWLAQKACGPTVQSARWIGASRPQLRRRNHVPRDRRCPLFKI
jgi:hypothetical protein